MLEQYVYALFSEFDGEYESTICIGIYSNPSKMEKIINYYIEHFENALLFYHKYKVDYNHGPEEDSPERFYVRVPERNC
jgi:uncharacterized phage-like protein YoqJ